MTEMKEREIVKDLDRYEVGLMMVTEMEAG